MKLKIGQRLAVGFGFVLFLTLLLTAYSVSQVNKVGNSLSLINDVNSLKQRYAINFRGSVHDRAIILRDLILIQDRPALDPELADFKKLEDNYADSAVRLDELFAAYKNNSAEEIAALTAIKEIENQTNPVVAQVKALRLSGELAEAQQLMMSSAKPLFIEWLRRINVFIDLKEAENNAITQSTRSLTSGFALISWLITLMAITLGGIAAWFISHSIITPLKYAVASADSMAKGDMSQQINVTGADETTDLLQSLHYLQQGTRKTIFDIQSTAEQLQQSAKTLAEITVKGSDAADQQNQELHHAASAITEMSGSVAAVAENAKVTAEATSAAQQSANSSAERVVYTVDSLQQMLQETSKTAQLINNLSLKSQDIGKVLDVIGSLAEQTNLLALNAAIEAARAGEAGRGFAVVADEVRNLASKTQASTLSISQIIEDIQLGTTNAVKAVERSCEMGNETAQLANEAVSSLEKVKTEISVINDKNYGIANAANEQADVAHNVEVAISSVSLLAQQVEQIADNIKQTSQALEGLAISLVSNVNRFKI